MTYLSRTNEARYRLGRVVAVLRERTRLQRLPAREANNITASSVAAGKPYTVAQHTTKSTHSRGTNHQGGIRGRTNSVRRRAQLNRANNATGEQCSRASPTYTHHRLQHGTTYAAQLFSKMACPSSSAAALAGVADSTPTAMARSRLQVPADALPIAAGIVATGTARRVAVATPFCEHSARRTPPSDNGAALAKAGTKRVPNAMVDDRRAREPTENGEARAMTHTWMERRPRSNVITRDQIGHTRTVQLNTDSETCT